MGLFRCYGAKFLASLIITSIYVSPALAVDVGMSLPFTEDWKSLKSSHAPQYTFQWENDAFLVGTISDRFYTNGLKGSYDFYADDLYFKTDEGQLKPMGCENNAGRIHLNKCERFNASLDREFIDNRIYKVNKGIFVSQGMFTPSDISWEPQDIGRYERPYAGWAQVGFFSTQANTKGYERFEWAIGCVGKCSRADIAQENIHRNLGDQLPLGWDTQIKDAPTLQAKYERTLQMMSMPWSDRHFMEPYFVAEVGNINIRSGLGMRFEFPIGNTSEEIAVEQDKCSEELNLEAKPVNSPLTRSLYLSHFNQKTKKQSDCLEVQYHIKNYITSREIRLYVDFSGHLVAYNGLLQGPLGYDNDSQHLTTGHKPLLTTLSGGFQVKWHRVALDFSYHSRSTESDGEALAFGEHSWLGLKVSTPDNWYMGIPASLGILWGVSKSGF